MNAASEHGRLSRSGTPRSCEPDGRPAERGDLREAELVWDLWNLRAVFPAATREDLLQILTRREQGLAREREALAGLRTGDQSCLAPGRRFLAAHPEMRTGITVSLHQGPYQLLAEPWLAAGLDPVLLVTGAAAAEFAGVAEELGDRLGHGGRLTLLEVGRGDLGKKAVAAIRAGRPLLVYLDGNTGQHGPARTRRRGLGYRLPGREIRLRTGLARLACRLAAPIHPVSLCWRADQVGWDSETSLAVGRGDDPLAVTRTLFDWLFSQVMRRPDQWHHWSMIKDSATCFANAGLDEPRVPRGLREDFRRAYDTCLERSPGTVRLILEKEVQVWPGDVLADLSEDRFYPAAGLGDTDLDALRKGHPTLAEMAATHGLAWVRFHGLRLCLLGMARLGG